MQLNLLVAWSNPRDRVLLGALTLLLLVFARLAYSVALLVADSADAPVWDRLHLYQTVVLFGELLAFIRFLVILRRHAYDFSGVSSLDKVSLWGQTWFTLCVMVYTEGPGMGPMLAMLMLLPAVAPIIDVPVPLVAAFTAVTSVVLLLLDVNGHYDIRFARFEEDPHVLVRWLSASAAFFLSFLVAAWHSNRLARSRRQTRELGEFVQLFSGYMGELALDRARELIERHRRVHDWSDAVEDGAVTGACQQCIVQLARLRPYLPSGLVGGDPMFDGEVATDGGDDDDFFGDDEEEDDASPYATPPTTAPRGRGAAATTAFGAEDDTDAGGELQATTTNLRARTCTIMQVECCFVLEAPTAAEASRRAARFTATVVEQVLRNDGVVDSMSPWAITASFNGQSPCPRHAKRACSAALGVASRIGPHSKESLEVFIAVDTRSNLAGVCGVDRLRARVVCGEGVELVRKLPKLAQYLRSPVVITDSVNLEVSSHFDTVPVDVIRPAWVGEGQAEEVTLFNLRIRRSTGGQQVQADDAYSEAFSHLRNGAVSDSLHMLTLFHELNRRDVHSARLYAIATRLQEQEETEPLVRRELQWAVLRGEEDVDRWTTDQTDASNNGDASMRRRQGRPDDDEPEEEESNFVGALEKLKPEQENKPSNYNDDDEENGGLISMFTFGADENDEEEDRPAQRPQARSANPSTRPGTAMVGGAHSSHASAAGGGGGGLGGGAIGNPMEGLPNQFYDDVLLEKWLLSRKALGTGSFSSVFLGMSSEGLLVAMKCVDLRARQTNKSQLIEEVTRMRKLQHHNIVSYISCVVIKNDYFIIVMEYVSGGSLKSLLDTFGPPPLAAIRKYVVDLLRGLRYLHENGMIHCDIKPHNALLTPDGSCKLSDFGATVNVTLYGQGSGEDDVMVRGTSWYLAPEACRNEITTAVDIWSVGITVIELITGRLPWDRLGNEANFIRELGKNEAMMPTIPSTIPSNAAAFCKQCLRRNPLERPTAEALLRTPFLTG